MVWVVGEGSRLHGVTDLPVEHPDAADLGVERDAHRAQRVVGRGGDLNERQGAKLQEIGLLYQQLLQAGAKKSSPV